MRYGLVGEMEYRAAPYFWEKRRRLTDEERRRAAEQWAQLVREDALLRAVVKGEVRSVGEDFYDEIILSCVTKTEETAAVAIGSAMAKIDAEMCSRVGDLLIYRRLRGGNRRLGRYAVRGLNPALILWGMLLMAATNVVLEPLLQLLPEIPDFYGRGWRALLLTVVMAPLAEEFLCRGILLDAARAKGGAAYGLLFSALFFGVIHFYPAAVVNAFVMGLLLGFIYIRSNSLYIVVILHAFNNALAMLLLTLGYAHTTLYELMSAHGLKMLYTVVYGVSLGIFLVAGYMVWKTIARLREQEQAAAEAQ